MRKGHIFLFANVPFGSVVAQLKRKGRNTWAEARSQRAECVGGFQGHSVAGGESGDVGAAGKVQTQRKQS